MDRSAATKVEWREWGPAAFAEAERTGRPVLLSLTAPWCSWCREMDETTYADPRIAANVNDGFVPVSVDVDRRPRVRERYNMGGFPSTVFLTPAGTIITGATYLGPDGFRDILDTVRRTWDARGLDAGRVPRPLADATPPGGTVTDDVERRMVDQLGAAFDDEYGGWGSDAKFPLPETVEFALVRARDQALRTLEAIRTHLLDTYDGGFYRYATRRDWGDPHREKLTDENAALVRAFARAYRYTGDEAYRDPAERTVEYLTTTLWTGDAFAGSQAGDDAYYRLGPADREAADPPRVDDTVYAGRNALAVEALLVLSAYVDGDRSRRYAERALDTIRDALVDDGVVVHCRTRDERAGTKNHQDADARERDHERQTGGDAEAERARERDGDEGNPERGLLVDQARVLAALMTAAQVTGADTATARAVADHALATLQADHGAFRDGPAAGPGLLDRPLFPLDANAAMADALFELGVLTGADRYRRAAREAVGAFADAADRMGVEVAGYAATAARLSRPRVVRVGTPAGSDLHRAALRVVDHESVVVPGADVPDGEARLFEDGDLAGTATSPAGLADLATGDG